MDSRYRKRSDIKTLIKLHNHNAGRLVSKNFLLELKFWVHNPPSKTSLYRGREAIRQARPLFTKARRSAAKQDLSFHFFFCIGGKPSKSFWGWDQRVCDLTKTLSSSVDERGNILGWWKLWRFIMSRNSKINHSHTPYIKFCFLLSLKLNQVLELLLDQRWWKSQSMVMWGVVWSWF